MKVFVSSTCYDLIDVRAEVGTMLLELGVTPVLSDDKLSDFKVEPQANSIATCLTNVDAADAVVLILDRRYGPRLGSVGFENKSATHLEYLQAKKSRRPTYVFARDRLLADYAIWLKNGKPNQFKGAWAHDQKDWQGLFELLEDRRPLDAARSDSNWIDPFTNSVDLKEAIQLRLAPAIKPKVLVDAIAKNEFPRGGPRK